MSKRPEQMMKPDSQPRLDWCVLQPSVSFTSRSVAVATAVASVMDVHVLMSLTSNRPVPGDWIVGSFQRGCAGAPVQSIIIQTAAVLKGPWQSST